MTIEETRRQLKLPDTYTDEQVQEIIDFTQSLAGIFIDQTKVNLKNHKLKVRGELKELGYSEKEITDYEVLRSSKSKHSVSKRMKKLDEDYTEIYNKLQNKYSF